VDLVHEQNGAPSEAAETLGIGHDGLDFL